jgi:hypothetical protein
MKVKTFRRFVGAYGADPARWPSRRRAAALALLAASDEARRAQAEARALDRALDQFTPDVDSARSARLLAGVIEKTRTVEPSGPIMIPDAIDPWWWRSAVILGTMACLGFFIGISGAISEPATARSTSVDVFTFGMGPLARLEQ